MRDKLCGIKSEPRCLNQDLGGSKWIYRNEEAADMEASLSKYYGLLFPYHPQNPINRG